MESGESLHDFCIENPAPGFYSLIGIKTPGLTSSNELGLYLAQMGAAHLEAAENPSFNPCRKAIEKKQDPDYYDVICRCEGITRGEILEAIRRGATTVDGVKRRVGCGMGRCQGSRCAWEIAKILKETGVNPEPLF
jgi:glycerol-3-phosphate dehydrogenase